MTTVKTSSGKTVLVPIKTYCYKPLKESLEELVSREGFEENCEQWRHREVKENVYGDVYDGGIWKNFNKSNNNYFDQPRNYAFMLNVDCFCPFKHVKSVSLGAIYLVCLNG